MTESVLDLAETESEVEKVFDLAHELQIKMETNVPNTNTQLLTLAQLKEGVESTVKQEFSVLEKEVCDQLLLKDIHVSKKQLTQTNKSVTKTSKKLVFNGIKKTNFIESDFYLSKNCK